MNTILPLGIVNYWLERGLIKWDGDLQDVLLDWERCKEYPQLGKEAKKFKKISGYEYIGPIQK